MFKIHRSFDLSTGVKNKSIAVVNTEGHIKVVYHNTIVLSTHNGSIQINNGGWDTISTMYVINNALEKILGHQNIRLYRKRKKTYVRENNNEFEFDVRHTFKIVE